MTEIHPLSTPGVYAKAERASTEAFLAATTTDGNRLMKLMDRAAAASLKQSGCSAELAAFYAECITADVLAREPRKR